MYESNSQAIQNVVLANMSSVFTLFGRPAGRRNPQKVMCTAILDWQLLLAGFLTPT